MRKKLLVTKRLVFQRLLALMFLLVGFTGLLSAQIAQRGTATTAISTTASVTVNKPIGVVVGDIMIANVGNYFNGTNVDASSTGWTVIAGSSIERGRATLLYKIAGASEPADYTFSVTTSSTATAAAIVAFSGVNTSTPFDVTAPTGWTTANNTTINNLPSITTVNAGSAILAFGASSRITSTTAANFTSWTLTNPTLSELFDVGHNNVGNTVAVGGAWGIRTTAGATGAGGFTCTPNTNPRNMGGIMIALRPCATNTAGTASSTPTLCINTALTNITHTTTGATGIGTATGLPAGVTAAWSSNTITISGTPTASGTFNYSIPLTGGCGTMNATGTITVRANNTITRTSAAATVAQTLCANTAITNITYATTGATGATVSGLPAGVTGNWASNVFTISGTPTASGTFNFTVTMTGGCSGGTNTATGSIVVNPAVVPSVQIGSSVESILGSASWNFNTAAPTTTPNNVTISNVTAGNSNNPGALISNGNPSDTYNGASGGNNIALGDEGDGLNTGAGGNAYFQFTITPAAGYWFSLNSIAFGSRSSGGNDGPQDISIRSSANGYGSSIYTAGINDNSDWEYISTPISNALASGSSAVTIRVYGFGGDGNNNSINWRIDDLLIGLTVNSLTAGTSNTFCTGTTPMFIAAPTNGGTTPAYQWRVNGTNVGTNSNVYFNPALNDNDVVTVVMTSNATCASPTTGTSNAVTVDIQTSLLTTTGASNCGSGNLTVSATSSCNVPGSSISWFANATGGTAVATGASYAANYSATSTVYAQENFIGGETVYGSEATGTANRGLQFTLFTDITLNSVNIESDGNANITIQLWNATTNAPLVVNGNTYSATVAVVAGNNVETLGWFIPAGVGYRLVVTNMGGLNLTRTPNFAFPESLPGVGSITGNVDTGGADRYNIFYNWNYSTTRVPATVTISPNVNAGTLSGNQNLCASGTVTFTSNGDTGGSWTSSNLSVATVNGTTGEITPVAAGTSTITYTVSGTAGCANASATRTVTVSDNNTAGTASSTPTLCINTALTNITHATTGATGIGTATGLPAGVTAAWSSNTITISGTPTASGTFNYSIPLTGGCGTVNATGTITVTPANTAGTASSTPTLCINTALTNITHATTGATGIGTAAGLPAGVTAAWSSNTITISGTPTASGTFPYSIPLTGGCGTVNATGTITVTPANTAGTASSTPTLCINTALTNITHATTGATGIGTAAGLPAGVTAAWSANTITISGTPTASGIFNYSIPLTGGCGSVNATGTITVTPAVTPSVSIVSNDADNSICSGTSVAFTATPNNGGTTPAYQWKLNGGNVGSNATTYTNSALANGDVVTVVLTANNTCQTASTANGNSITTAVINNVTPSVSIVANNAVICPGAGNVVTFTATPTNGGSMPAYQWKVNGANAGTNSSVFSSSALAGGDNVKVDMLANNQCQTVGMASSSSIAITALAVNSYYLDNDGDGYGNPSTGISDCTNPAGYVMDNTDCLDSNGDVYPDGAEICNGIDDNCDGNNDEGVELTTYYLDNDGDGFGGASGSIQSCEIPSGYIQTGGDCNDNNVNVRPTAQELCSTNFDDDCDGLINEICFPGNDNPNFASNCPLSTSPTFCSPITGTLQAATSTTVFGSGTFSNNPDVWYYFTANGPGMTIRCTPSVNNVGLELRTSSGELLKSMDATSLVADEYMNYANLNVGSQYYLRVMNMNPSTPGGNFTLCARRIVPGTSVFNYTNVFVYNTGCTGVSPTNLSSLTTSTIVLTPVGGGTEYSAPGPVAPLGSFTSANGSGVAYNTVYTGKVIRGMSYPLGDGTLELLSFVTNITNTLNVLPLVDIDLGGNYVCPRTWTVGSLMRSDRWICGAVKYQWRFEQYLNGQPYLVNGNPVIIEQYGPNGSRDIFTLSAYGFLPGTEWRVKIRPVFPNDVHGDYGPDEQCIRFKGSFAAVPIIDGDGEVHVDTDQLKVQMYPNPSNSGLVTIYHENWLDTEVEVLIFDGTGRKVFENHYQEVSMIQEDLSHLSNGVYTIQLNWGSQSEQKHWMLQR